MSHSDLNLLVPREATEYLAICGLSPSGNALVNEVIANVLPVGRPETDLRVWPVAALVLVADPARRTRIDPAVAAEALGLTGMESRVAVLLAEGMTVRDVAAAMGRGESTIRSHVKHMFAKHGLSRQADLVRLVLAVGGAPESRH